MTSPSGALGVVYLLMEDGTDRVVALVDMDCFYVQVDCFYVQVEQRLDPTLRGVPCVVAQYKTWRGGGYVVRLTTSLLVCNQSYNQPACETM
ncbi:hypothetical protein NHX12_022821 [Muraenolepis orangiensis]|uniref:UmuC domain-containing protein n=1 Tax=Muraenolepis orangiensis TaxID=630683 RepID=A0A9Q0ESI3_9TELE|nr:hypothetical protein NHX12_022821 [Muraenolepis orangiensis]